jgi:hypothetical protein
VVQHERVQIELCEVVVDEQDARARGVWSTPPRVRHRHTLSAHLQAGDIDASELS